MATRINSRVLLIVLITISLLISIIHYKNLMKEEDARLNALSELYELRLNDAINEAIDATELLKNIITEADGVIEPANIITILKILYKEDLHIAISYMPNGVIEYSYPEEENKSFIGMNVLHSGDSQIDALTAKNTEKLTLSGPYTLDTGRSAIVARNPIYLHKDGTKIFWGFSTVVIDPINGLLNKTGMFDLDKIGYEYKVESIYNNQSTNLYTSKKFDAFENSNHYTFQIAQGKWNLSMYRPNIIYTNLQNSILIALAFVSFSILIYIAFKKIELQQKKTYEQSLTDSLTSLKNRKALMQFEKKDSSWKKEGFSAFYIDLNKFKPINDTYGHEVGDAVLKMFSSRLLSNFKKDTFIARLGGDEFLIILSTEISKDECLKLEKRIINISETVFFINNTEIYISSSVGYATYPSDSDSFNGTLAKADENMFIFKKENQKGR